MGVIGRGLQNLVTTIWGVIGRTVTLMVLPKNSLNIAVLIKIYLTMTAQELFFDFATSAKRVTRNVKLDEKILIFLNKLI